MEQGLITVLTPDLVDGEESQGEKRLARMVKLWEKLTPDEQRRFQRHIEGTTLIDVSQELIPTIAAAKLLGVSFYKVKAMVQRGELQPAEVRQDYFGKVLGYLFRRDDVLAAKKPPANLLPTDRRARIIRGRMAGLSFKALGEEMGISAGRVTSIFDRTLRCYHRRQEVPVLHKVTGDTWEAQNCDSDHQYPWWPADGHLRTSGSIFNYGSRWNPTEARDIPVTSVSAFLR